MKKADVVATKYAEALIKIAMPQNRLDAQAEELKVVVNLLSSNEKLLKILKHPSLNLKDKEKLINQALKSYNLSDNTLNFLSLLLKKNRLSLLEGILLKYRQLIDKLQNRYQVDIVSVIPLKKHQEEKLSTKLSNILNAKIKLNININPKILGGLVLHIGDKIIDGSIIRRLFMLRKELIGKGGIKLWQR
jgi:F-type H+-transporting ATPase subunit delta